MPFAKLLKKRLFEPLNLRHTYFIPGGVLPGWLLAAEASGYQEQSLCEEVLNVSPPCRQFPLDALLGHDFKSINLAFGDGGIIATLPDVANWVRALFSNKLLAPPQQTELFSLVSQKTGQPIAATSPHDPAGYSLGIGQDWLAFEASPVWLYQGEAYGYEVLWTRRDGDNLITVMAQNSSTGNNHLASLYPTVFGILEPQNVVASGATAAPQAASLGRR